MFTPANKALTGVGFGSYFLHCVAPRTCERLKKQETLLWILRWEGLRASFTHRSPWAPSQKEIIIGSTWQPISIQEPTLGSLGTPKTFKRHSGEKEHLLHLESESLRDIEDLRSNGHPLLITLVHTCVALAVMWSIVTVLIHLILPITGWGKQMRPSWCFLSEKISSLERGRDVPKSIWRINGRATSLRGWVSRCLCSDPSASQLQRCDLPSDHAATSVYIQLHAMSP